MGLIRLALLVVWLVLLAACGDDNDRADTLEQRSTTTTTVDDTTTTTRPVDTHPETALLTLNDMPTGWTQTTPSTDNEPFCADAPPEPEALDEATAQFQLGATGPNLTHTVSIYDNGEQAMNQLAKIIDTCREFTTDNATGSFQPLAFPELGDETLAVSLTAQSSGITAGGELVYIRHGNAIAVLATSAIGGGTVDEFEDLARLAAQRLEPLS